MSQRTPASRALAVAVFGLAAVVLLVSGFWMGVRSSQDVMGSDRTRGTMLVTGCKGVSACTGTFTPAVAGAPGAPKDVTISKIAASKKGERLLVAIRPGTSEAVRTGTGGFVLAWVAFGGALLLSALILASGLAMRRVAVFTALAGAAILVAAWLAR